MSGPAARLPVAPAHTPPPGIDGLDPSWSTLVHVPTTDGVGRTWHVLDNGVASPRLTVLCVHGNPSWSFLFRHLLDTAPADVRVIAVDQLDMGFSERTGVVRRLATRVDDLAELTAVLAPDGPVVTVAHDWGGPVSLGWALRHVDRLTGVVLMNTAVHQPDGSHAPTLIRLARSRALLRNVTERTTMFIRGAVEMSRPRLPRAVRDGFLAPYRSADRRAAIAGFVADIPLDPDHPSFGTLDAIASGLDVLADVPTLLVWGSKDLVFSDLYLHDLERRLPHADVHRFARAAHFVSEDADAFGVIVDWIGALDRPVRLPGHPGGPARPSTLTRTFGELGDQVAIADMTNEAAQITFAEFARQVERTAGGLVAAGVRPGERVALMVPPGIDLAVTLYACWHVRAVIVLVDSGLGPSGMSAAVASADPAHLIGIPKALAAARVLGWPGRRWSVGPMDPFRRRVLGVAGDLPSLRRRPMALPAPPTCADPAAVVFTSGATGPSKGVLYTHGQLEAQRDALVALFDITTADRLVAAFAPFALYGPAMGITSVVPDMDVAAPATLTAATLGDAAVRVDATLVFASPGALANVVATQGDLTSPHHGAFGRVRTLMSAGAPVRPGLLREAAALFPNATAHTPYGMTECLPVASIELAEIHIAGTGDGVCVGQPVDGVEVRIRPLDPSGSATGDLTSEPGVVGEIVVRAPHARAGYDRLWRTEFAASSDRGRHATGDVGHIDAEGRLWVGGRLGHVISTADGPVTPVRFEQAVETLAGVGAAAVVGVGPRGAQQMVVVVRAADVGRTPRAADAALTDRVRGVVDRPVASVFEVDRL
ncbi:MAG: alpha/beta fold hydrolase, partial [Ilumatobacteraceae bacterium]